MHLLLALLLVGCGGSGGSSGSGSSDSVTIASIDSINSSNVSRLVIEGTCQSESSSTPEAGDNQSHSEADSESDTPLEEGILDASKPFDEETNLGETSLGETSLGEANLEEASLEDDDGTDLGTLADGVEGAVIKLSITPLSGRNVISQQVTCVGGAWITEFMDMTRFYTEASFVVTATKVLESGEEGPLATLNIPNHFQCPWGYASVPAPKGEASKSFCVAKYEMKNKNLSSALSPTRSR